MFFKLTWAKGPVNFADQICSLSVIVIVADGIVDLNISDLIFFSRTFESILTRLGKESLGEGYLSLLNDLKFASIFKKSSKN